MQAQKSLKLKGREVFAIAILSLMFVAIHPTSAQISVNFHEKYQDWQGNWHDYTNDNVTTYPFYTVTDIGNNYIITRLNVSVKISKHTWLSYNFKDTQIQPIVTIQNFSQINRLVTKVNSTAWYLTSFFSASQYQSVSDRLIDMGVFKRSFDFTVTDVKGNTTNSSNINYSIYPHVSGNNIQIWFNPQTFVGFQYPLTITENTIIVNNATTIGFTSTNVSLNGSWWQADYGGSLRLPLIPSIANNISCFWGLGESSGTIVHGISNTSGGLPDSNCQGTWHGTIQNTINSTGNGMYFNNSDSNYIDVGNAAILQAINGTNRFSLHAKANATGDSIITKGYPFLSFGFDGSKHIQFRVSNSSSGNADNHVLIGSTVVSNLHDIDGVLNGGTMSVYVDNVLDGTSSFAGQNIFDTTNFWIGGNNYGGYEKGIISQVYLLNGIQLPTSTPISTSVMPVFYNIAAQTGSNIINNITPLWNGGDASNNISIYIKQNNSANPLIVICLNIANATTCELPANRQYRSSDIGIEMHGNGTNTIFVAGFTANETAEVLPTIIISNQTGNFYVNHSISLSGGVQSYTSYNWSVNGTWTNGTTATYKNNTYIPHAWQNVTVCGYDGINGVIGTCATQNTQIPNNLITISNVSTSYSLIEGQTLYIDVNYADADSDTGTFARNFTQGTFNTGTGVLTWNTVDGDQGTYYWQINVSDGYGSVSTQALTVTVSAPTQPSGTSSGGGRFGGGIISDQVDNKNVEPGVQSYSETVILSGNSARIPIISSISTSPPLKYLNLFFSTSYSGEYTIGTTTYTTYSPALEGAREYFSVSPQLSLTGDSNMEIAFTTPIEVFQLTSAGWIELRGIQRLADGSYGVPISSLGIFAIKESGEAVMQAQQEMYVQPTDKSIKQQIQDVVSKVRAFVQSPPTLQEIRAGIREAISNVRLQAQKLGQNLKREIGILSALKGT